MALTRIVVGLSLLTLLLVTRPPASDWPAVVTKLRRKEANAAGSLALALKPLGAAWQQRDFTALAEIARSRWDIGMHMDAEDARIWAFDALLLTIACTHRKCFVGVLGAWHVLPGAQVDLWALLACHGAACAVAHAYGMATFYRWCSPRASEPLTIAASIFASASPMELLWLYGSLLGVGADLQHSLGRAGFLALYCGGGLSSVLLAMYLRHSVNGGGGALASVAFHALRYPHARHSIFGLTLGAKAAVAVQVGLASLPAFGGAARPEAVLALNGLPVAFGAGAFQVLRRTLRYL